MSENGKFDHIKAKATVEALRTSKLRSQQILNEDLIFEPRETLDLKEERHPAPDPIVEYSTPVKVPDNIASPEDFRARLNEQLQRYISQTPNERTPQWKKFGEQNSAEIIKIQQALKKVV